MKFKLLLIPVMFLLFLSIAFADIIFDSGEWDDSVMDVYTTSGDPNNPNNAAILQQGDLDGANNFATTIFNLTVFRQNVTSGSTILDCMIEMNFLLVNGVTDLRDLRMYPSNKSCSETTCTHNFMDLSGGQNSRGNMSTYNGTKDLIKSLFPVNPSVGQRFNISLDTDYCQDWYDNPDGKFNKGLMLFNFIAEDTGGQVRTRQDSSESLTEANRPKWIVNSTLVSPLLQEFTLTAKDTYDDIAITNITILITNSSFAFNDSTVNGTLKVNNASIPSFNKFYDITFGSNDTGGYFNRTFSNINISNAGSFEGDIFQSVLELMALDGLNNQTIQSFSARTNNSFDSTTTGSILILIKNGTFQLNVTANGFDKLVTNFSINVLQNNSLNVTMGSIFNFRLVREETNTPFQVNLTNSTELNIFCPNETIRISFNTTNNISQIINCQFTLMQVVVDYGTTIGSYFRTLIPPFSQKNITWYLIDLIAGDTAIQKVIQLIDLTGDFSDATLRVKRAIPGETTLQTIIEQQFDISNEVNLFLVKDAIYTINIENDVEDVALGNLIPTEAGTQTITLPKLDFVPTETTLGEQISWAYTFNITTGILRLQYVDTTNLTTLVRFTVKNGSSPNLNQLFQGESNNNGTVTLTFNQVLANNTYVSELFFIHPGLSNFTETRPWYEFGGTSGALDLEGWSDTEQINFKKWFTWIFLAVWGMIWSRRYIGIGMTSLVIFLWIFKTLKWVDVPNLIFGFVTLLAVVGWIVEAMKKE